MPTFSFQLEFDENGAVTAIRRLNDVANAASRVSRAGKSAGKDLGSALWEAGKKIAYLVGTFKALEKAMSFLKRGIDLNSSLEQSKIGIATLITSMVNLEDAQGKALVGAEKYAAAQGIAADMMAEIQKLGLETTATSQELVEGVQSIMGPALQAGMALKDIPKFAVTGAQAMQTLGIPLNQMRTELEALLSGSINKSQDILAPKLFADINGDLNEYLKKLKDSGTLLAEIEKRLEPFRQAGADVGQTWSGIVNNLEEAVDTIAGIVTKDMLKDLKEAANLIQNLMISDKGNIGISEDFENIARLLTEISDRLGGAILSTIKDIVEYAKEFNSFLGSENPVLALDKLINALKLVAAAIIAVGIARKTHLSTVSLIAPFTASIGAIRNWQMTLLAARKSLVSFGKAVMSAVGGPWGIMLAGASIAFTELALCESKAERATRLHTEAQDVYQRTVAKVIDDTGKLTRALTEAEQVQVRASGRKLESAFSAELDKVQSDIEKVSNAWKNVLSGMVGNDSVALSDLAYKCGNIDLALKAVLETFRQTRDIDAFKVALENLRSGFREDSLEAKIFGNTLDNLISSGTFEGLASQIAKVTNATAEMANTATAAKQQMASGWNIDLSGAEKAIESMSKEIRKKQAQVSNFKTSEALLAVIPDMEVTDLKKVADSYQKVLKGTGDEAKAMASALESMGEKGKTMAEDSQKQLGTILKQRSQILDLDIKIEGQQVKTGRGVSSAGRSATIAQIDYKGALERTKQHIESLQQQLELDKTEDITKTKIKIEQKYQQELSKTRDEINKQIARRQLTPEQGHTLQGEKETALELEKQLALKEAQQKAEDKARQILETKLNFYRELEDLSGQYGLSLEYQNQLLESQAQEYLKITPELQDHIEEWERLKKLSNDTSFMAGLERGVRKFGAEYSDLASTVESLTTQMGSTIGNTLSDAFLKGKLSAEDFFQSIISMAAQAASNYFIGQIFSGIGGFFGSSEGKPSGGFSGTSSNTSAFGPVIPNGIYSAKGNVFTGGNLSSYSNFIVRSPTLFEYGSHLSAFARGAGLMGEAGPEAIMPLARTSSGDLGVRFLYDNPGREALGNYAKIISELQAKIREERQYSGNMPVVNVNIENNSNAQVQAGQVQPDGNGGFSVDILISQLEQGIVGRMKSGKSQIAQYQEKTYGMNRAGVIARGRGRN